jgi:diguanylate cyclase (GGDEF)-like protein
MSASTRDQIQVLMDRGEVEAAREAARSALPALSGAERGRMLLLLATASTLAGDALDGMRNGVAAREVFQALAAAGGPGLAEAQAGMCESLGRVAGALRLVGDHATAINTLEQAEALARDAGLKLPLALVLRQIGVCCSLVGRHRHAQTCLDEAETLLQSHGSMADRLQARLSTLNARNRLSESLPADSDERRLTLEATLPDWQALAEACAAAGQQRLAVMAQGNHAITLAEMGRHVEAIHELQALEPLYRSLGMRPNEGLCLGKLALSQLALGEVASARASAQRADAVLRSSGALDDLQEALEVRSQAEAACGDPAAALATLRRVRELDKRKSDEAARGTVAQRELRIELARLSSQWARHATTDALTGLGNRRALEQWMEQQLPRAERGLPLCVLLMDLDHFKWVNDSFGHAIGDEVLRRVARLIEHSCRDGDLAVRYGGEEFVLALAGVDIEAAAAVAERLRAALAAQAWGQLAAGLQVGVSIGVAAMVETANVPELFALADRRLYAAKFGGRDRVVSQG